MEGVDLNDIVPGTQFPAQVVTNEASPARDDYASHGATSSRVSAQQQLPQQTLERGPERLNARHDQ